VERASIELAALLKVSFVLSSVLCQTINCTPSGRPKRSCLVCCPYGGSTVACCILSPSKYLQALSNGPCLVFGLTTSALLMRGKLIFQVYGFRSPSSCLSSCFSLHWIRQQTSRANTVFLSFCIFSPNFMSSQISVITQKQTPSLQSISKASLDLWNPNVGNCIELRSRYTRAIQVKSATHNNRCSMVYT
jgi:hypothetical protein